MNRKNSRQAGPGLLYCDITQSWSAQGGGVRTYLLHKREHILKTTGGRHLLIVPGPEDSISEEAGGRAITVTVKSPRVPGSPNYRLMLRNKAVRAALDRYRPDLIECQDVYNLPWAAVGYRDEHPEVALTACYMTDFPTVYVERPLKRFLGRAVAGALGRIGYRYIRRLFAHFDSVGALSEAGGAAKLRALGIERVAVTPLGVEIDSFAPGNRDPELRAAMNVRDDQPLLIYVGRLDKEKRPHIVVEAFRLLPPELGARLVLLGDGPLRPQIAALGDTRIHMPGFVRDRAALARWLASADIYVSGMADETFGVSIVEAQASGLPVVGVDGGAMADRVSGATGRLGPIDDAQAMAHNILAVWRSDRAAMAKAARAEALRYSWDRAMEIRFGDVYPQALERAQGRAKGLAEGSSRVHARNAIPGAD